jgi:BNR repeat-like domain
MLDNRRRVVLPLALSKGGGEALFGKCQVVHLPLSAPLLFSAVLVLSLSGGAPAEAKASKRRNSPVMLEQEEVVFTTGGGKGQEGRKVTVTKELIVPIPPWPYAHVCSLAEGNEGEVLALWQAGTYEKARNSALWSSLRKPKTAQNAGESRWSPPRVAVRAESKAGADVCAMNACLFRNESGYLFLPFHVNGGENGTCYINGWQPRLTESADFGRTWLPPGHEFPAVPNGAMGCVKNQCVLLSNGKVGGPSPIFVVPRPRRRPLLLTENSSLTIFVCFS